MHTAPPRPIRAVLTLAIVLFAAAAAATEPRVEQPAAPALPDPATTAAVAAAEQFHNALQRGQGEAALQLLDPAVQIYEAGHVERSRDEYAASHLAADMSYARTAQATVKSRKAEVAGDLAWVASESEVQTERQGKPVKLASLETLVLKNTPQGWRIVHIHWSSRELKPTP